MRELLYASDRKILDMFSDPRFGPPRQRGGMLRIGGLSVSAQTQVHSPTENGYDRQEIAVKLERIINELRTRGVPDVTASILRPHQWMSFDLDLAYGTAHDDSGHLPDDVVLFAGETTSGESADRSKRSISLLLCGSIQHLRTEVKSAGRMGSGTHWLHEVMAKVNSREKNGVHVAPENLLLMLPSRSRPYASLETAAHDVHSVMLRYHPPSHRGRLSGLARVLLNIDDPQNYRRLIMATPLYVEVTDTSTERS